VRYLAKRTVPDHGEEWTSSGHRDYDYLEWIARLTSHIPDRGTHLVHYYGAYSNAHRGVARKREIFLAVPPEGEPPDSRQCRRRPQPSPSSRGVRTTYEGH
jgi:hypothetical protein